MKSSLRFGSSQHPALSVKSTWRAVDVVLSFLIGVYTMISHLAKKLDYFNDRKRAKNNDNELVSVLRRADENNDFILAKKNPRREAPLPLPTLGSSRNLYQRFRSKVVVAGRIGSWGKTKKTKKKKNIVKINRTRIERPIDEEGGRKRRSSHINKKKPALLYYRGYV